MLSEIDLDVNNYNNKELLQFLDYNNSVPHNEEEIKQKYEYKITSIANADMRDYEKEKFINFISEVKEKVINNIFKQPKRQEYDSGELIKTNKNFMNYENSITNTERPVINREELPVNPVFSQEYVPGIINPLKRRILKKTLLIDTKFRKDQKAKSTDFTFVLPTVIKNAISMSLASLEFPNTSYTINKEHITNELTIDVSGSKINFELDPGNFSAGEFVTLMNTLYLPAGGIQNMLTCVFDDNTGKISFYTLNNPPPNIKIDFRVQNHLHRNKMYNLGWILGFREEQYELTDIKIFNNTTNTFQMVKGIQAESMFDSGGFKYICVVVKDFKNSTYDFFTSAFQNSISKSDILAKIPIAHAKSSFGFEDSSDGTYKKREYFGPQDIEKLKIQILDDYERIIDINEMNYSMTLEFDCIYNL
jgi:hypothetical protein